MNMPDFESHYDEMGFIEDGDPEVDTPTSYEEE
jgi:hypothetical protein